MADGTLMNDPPLPGAGWGAHPCVSQMCDSLHAVSGLRGSRAQHPCSAHAIISGPARPALGSRGSLGQKPGAPLDVRWTPYRHSAPAAHRPPRQGSPSTRDRTGGPRGQYSQRHEPDTEEQADAARLLSHKVPTVVTVRGRECVCVWGAQLGWGCRMGVS